MRVILISPTRNEGKYIRDTLESMAKQTIEPIKWLIVDDGSSDDTGKIVQEYQPKLPYLEYLYLPDRGFRKPAVGVMEAFYKGYERIKNLKYDVIAKFDADLRFPPNMLEIILDAFIQDPKLGITGGTRYEQAEKGGPFKKVLLPKGFVGGPTKFYRRSCFEDIGGLIVRAGWDGVDTIRASMNGWETGEQEDLKIYHLKPTGMAKGEGLKRACEKYGDVSYYMGGYFWYFILRVIGRSINAGNFKIGYYMITGYLKSILKKEKRESKEFRKYLKQVQRKNVTYWYGLLRNRLIVKSP
jgi:glycosyltransferase involved in cell wall biosynthesis